MIIKLTPGFDPAPLVQRFWAADSMIDVCWSHIQNPKKRADSTRVNARSTLMLGLVEIVGAISVAFGIWIQIGAALLMLVMIGAIYKKIAAWQIGFYSDKSLGWHYDFLLLCANFVFLTGNGGHLVLVGCV